MWDIDFDVVIIPLHVVFFFITTILLILTTPPVCG